MLELTLRTGPPQPTGSERTQPGPSRRSHIIGGGNGPDIFYPNHALNIAKIRLCRSAPDAVSFKMFFNG